MMNKAISIKQVAWDEYQQPLSNIRETVFIKEQHVPPELEWDEHDADCLHLLACNNNDEGLVEYIGTVRMLNDGHIGRMAVLAEWRNQGVGSTLLAKLISIARQQQLEKVYLYAQTSAIEFYLQHQFNIVSDEFMDAGIPHREMEHKL